MEKDTNRNCSQPQIQTTAKPRTSKAHAPHPPVMKYNPVDSEIQESDIPSSYSSSNRRALLKQSKENLQEPQVLKWRRIDNGIEKIKANPSSYGGLALAGVANGKASFVRTNERLLATFYVLFYTKEESDKEWQLLAEEFIPVCFIHVLGDANNPFKIIAVHDLKRVMDFQVKAQSKSSRNKSFIKWQNNSLLYGGRFGKEQQAMQFHETILRMVSTIKKTAEILKKPERKAVVGMLSDPKSSALIHTKVSIMVKLPNKESTVISVPGLLTMGELFELICEKEKLKTSAHLLSVPKIDGQKVPFDSHTAVGSLKVREVSLIETGLSHNTRSAKMDGSIEEIEDLEIMSEENKALDIYLPSGSKKSFMVPLDMNMKKLITYLCKKEQLNSRFHSLQYVDFKHEFLDMDSLVGQLEVEELRLMDKRGAHLYRKTRSIPNISSQAYYETTNLTNTNPGLQSELRKSSVLPQPDADEKSPLPRSLSLEVLQEDNKGSNRRLTDTDVENKPQGKVTHRPEQPPKPKPYIPRAASVGSLVTRKINGSSVTTVSPVQLTTVPPDSGKLKRKAPPPPPRPSFRTPPGSSKPDSELSPQSPNLSTALTPTISPSTQKKRKAPPRPSYLPVKSQVLVQNSNKSKDVIEKQCVNKIENGESVHTNSVVEVDKNSPPVFFAPPPPEELPPPLDECATPVCPVDEDDFYTRSFTANTPNNSYEGITERSSQESRGSPEGCPSLVYHSTPLKEIKSTEGIKANTVSTSRMSPIESEMQDSSLEFLVPPFEFSNQNLSASEATKIADGVGVSNNTTSDESVEVPQPLPSVEELVAMITPNKENPNIVPTVIEDCSSKEAKKKPNPVGLECPIPPPEDFANLNPPAGFESEQSLHDNKHVKKLTVDKSLFPWLDEPAPIITPVWHDKAVIKRQDSSLEGDEDMEYLTISPDPLSPGPDNKLLSSTDFLRFLEIKKQESIENDAANESEDEIPFEPNLEEKKDISTVKNITSESKEEKRCEDDDSLNDLKLFALEISKARSIKRVSRDIDDESLNDIKTVAADLRSSSSNKTVERAVKEEHLEVNLPEAELVTLPEETSAYGTSEIEKTFPKTFSKMDIVEEEITYASQVRSVESDPYGAYLLLQKSDESRNSSSKLPDEGKVHHQSNEMNKLTEAEVVPVSDDTQQCTPDDISITSLNSMSSSPSQSPVHSPQERVPTLDTIQKSSPLSLGNDNDKGDFSTIYDASATDIHRDLSQLLPDQQAPASAMTANTEQNVIETPSSEPHNPPFTAQPLKGDSDRSRVSLFTEYGNRNVCYQRSQSQPSQQQLVSRTGILPEDQNVPSRDFPSDKNVKEVQQSKMDRTPENEEKIPKEVSLGPGQNTQPVNHEDLQVCSAVKKYLRGNSIGHSTRPRSWVAPSSRDTSSASKRPSLIWTPDFNPAGMKETKSVENTSRTALKEVKSEPVNGQQNTASIQLKSGDVISKTADTDTEIIGQDKNALKMPEPEMKTEHLVPLPKQWPSIGTSKSCAEESGATKLVDSSFSQVKHTTKEDVSVVPLNQELNTELREQKSCSDNGKIVEKENEKQPNNVREEITGSKPVESDLFMKQKTLADEEGSKKSSLPECNGLATKNTLIISTETIKKEPKLISKLQDDKEIVDTNIETSNKQGSVGQSEKTLRLPSYGRKKYEILFASSNSSSDQAEKKQVFPNDSLSEQSDKNEQNSNEVSSSSSTKNLCTSSAGKNEALFSGRKKYEILFSNSTQREEPKIDKTVSEATVNSCSASSVSKLRAQFSVSTLKAPEVKKKPHRMPSEKTDKTANNVIAEHKDMQRVSENALKKPSQENILEQKYVSSNIGVEAKGFLPETLLGGKNVPPKVVIEPKHAPSTSVVEMKSVRPKVEVEQKQVLPKSVVETKNVPPKVVIEQKHAPPTSVVETKSVRPKIEVEQKQVLPKAVVETKSVQPKVVIESKHAPPTSVVETKRVQPKIVIEPKHLPPKSVVETKNAQPKVVTKPKQFPHRMIVQDRKVQPKLVIEMKEKPPQNTETISSRGMMTIVKVGAETDTSVVPTGVVARMKALKESQRASTG